MEAAHMKPMRDLTKVTIGIAEYENLYHEYLEVGGEPIKDSELKRNLKNILPLDLQKELLFKIDMPEPYSLFSSTLKASVLTLLQHQSKLPLHLVAAVEEDEGGESPDDFLLAMQDCDDPSHLFAIQQKFKRKFPNWKSGQQRKTPSPPAAHAQARPSRPGGGQQVVPKDKDSASTVLPLSMRQTLAQNPETTQRGSATDADKQAIIEEIAQN